MGTRTYGRYSFETSNEDKVLFPQAGFTKGDLMDYYEKVADSMLPHLKGRPLMMHRLPDGISGEDFYQKEIGGHFPDWIDHVKVKKKGGHNDMVVCEKKATLVYLANQGCIEPHVWLSRRDKPRTPDRIVFDLDPGGDDFGVVRTAARDLKETLERLGLRPFAMLSGSRGIHVVVPIQRRAEFDDVRDFARGVAETLVERNPDDYTLEPRKDKRKGRLFIDVLRNAYAQTSVASYAVRDKPDAPVATPVEWDEVGKANLSPRQYNIESVLRRLGQKKDPWSGIDSAARSLTEPRKKFARMREADT